jgi:hypothetical protein
LLNLWIAQIDQRARRLTNWTKEVGLMFEVIIGLKFALLVFLAPVISLLDDIS